MCWWTEDFTRVVVLCVVTLRVTGPPRCLLSSLLTVSIFQSPTSFVNHHPSCASPSPSSCFRGFTRARSSQAKMLSQSKKNRNKKVHPASFSFYRSSANPLSLQNPSDLFFFVLHRASLLAQVRAQPRLVDQRLRNYLLLILGQPPSLSIIIQYPLIQQVPPLFHPHPLSYLLVRTEQTIMTN